MDHESAPQAMESEIPLVRWEACEAFAAVDDAEVCATCGWLAEDHRATIAPVVTFPIARPARIRRAS
ncbi:MAG: hypothetical protein U0V73_15920 [Acidimicrobiia bacterium]